MNHEGKGEIAEEDSVPPSDLRKVTFRRDLDYVQHFDGDVDRKPEARDRDRNADVCDAKRKTPPGKKAGILRPRSISLSPPPLPPQKRPPSLEPRFKPSKLSDAIRRSNETRGCIEKLKNQIFHRLGQHYEPLRGRERERETPPNLAARSSSSFQHGSSSSIIEHLENSENEPSSIILARQKRRRVCLESTKAIMYDQSLPPTMMSFVEEALRAAHFLRRRRRENGHGRIVHQILVKQHIRVLKELELEHNENKNKNENNKGDTTNRASHSSRQQQSHASEPS